MRTSTALAAFASLALVACGDSGAPDSVVNGVAVLTQPASAQFAPSGGTFFVDPTVRYRKDGREQPPFTMDPELRALIRQQMTDAGFTEAADAASAAVGLTMVFATSTVDVYYSGGWCDIYYGWYGCYYPPVYAGSYRFGVTVLNMVDQGALPDPTALWSALTYGLVPDYAAPGLYDNARLIEATTRAFAQSPYIAAP